MEHKESKAIPKDAQVIQAILKDLGIQEYESRVVKQLLEFTYRYATSVLDEAQVFSQYAKKKTIDADDVKLAIQFQVEKMYSSPPPRDLLLDIARNKNAQCLPPIKSSAGTRLPPDRYSLTSCNYRLKPSSAIRQPSYSNMSTLAGGLGRQTGSLLSAGSSLPFSRQTIQMQMGKGSISRSIQSVPIIKQVETKDIGDSTGLKRKHEEQEP